MERKEEDDEEVERVLSLGDEKSLTKTWRGRSVVFENVNDCVGRCMAMACYVGLGGDIFICVLIKGINWMIRLITLDTLCTFSYIKHFCLLLFTFDDVICT